MIVATEHWAHDNFHDIAGLDSNGKGRFRTIDENLQATLSTYLGSGVNSTDGFNNSYHYVSTRFTYPAVDAASGTKVMRDGVEIILYAVNGGWRGGDFLNDDGGTPRARVVNRSDPRAAYVSTDSISCRPPGVTTQLGAYNFCGSHGSYALNRTLL